MDRVEVIRDDRVGLYACAVDMKSDRKKMVNHMQCRSSLRLQRIREDSFRLSEAHVRFAGKRAAPKRDSPIAADAAVCR